MRHNALYDSIDAVLHHKNGEDDAKPLTTKDVEALHNQVKSGLEKVREEMGKKWGEVETQLKSTGQLDPKLKADVDELITKSTAMHDSLAKTAERLEMLEKAGGSRDAALLTPGAQLIDSEEFKKSAFASSQVGRGQVLSVEVKNPMLTPDVSQGQPGVMNPMMLPGILPTLKQRLFLRDLIDGGRTSSNAISYVRMTGFTNNARPVSEGTRKPQSEIQFDTQMVAVTTLAHIFKASKQILDDFVGLQSLVDAEMRYGLAYVEEQQFLYGDGTGINIHGIVPQASTYDPAFAPALESPIDILRLAILQAELALLPATGIVLNPIDWARIELTKTTDGAYVWSNPLRLASPTLWGLPVVPTQAMQPDEFLTGGFRGGAQVFDRELANVVIATQNEDDFVKNLLTIRCEERTALVIKRPESFIHGSFGNPPPPDASSSS